MLGLRAGWEGSRASWEGPGAIWKSQLRGPVGGNGDSETGKHRTEHSWYHRSKSLMRLLRKRAKRASEEAGKGSEGLEKLMGLYSSKNIWKGCGGTQKGLMKGLGGYQ